MTTELDRGLRRRHLMVLGAFCATQPYFALPAQAQAEGWPNRAIKLIVPSSPGGAADLGGRVFARFLEEQTKRSVIVENRPGAGAVVGALAVKNSPPDGYTFLVAGNSTQAANPSLFAKLPYDPAKDFDEVGMFGVFPMVGIVRQGSDIRSVAALLQAAREKGGKLTFGHHAASALVPAELLKSRASIEAVGVPYKSLSQLTTDLVGGHIDFAFVDALSAWPSLKGGLVQAFAVTSPGPFPGLPNVSPVSATLPGFEVQGWLGLAAPKGTPVAIIERMNELLRAALAEPAVREQLERQGMAVRAQSASEHTRFVETDRQRWAEWVRIAKIQPANL